MSKYEAIIEAMKSGKRFKADSGHEITLVQDNNLRWHLMCVAQCWSNLEGRNVYVGEKFLEYPMDLEDFVTWVDSRNGGDYEN